MIFPNPFYFAAAVGRIVWAKLRGEKVLVPVPVEVFRLETCENGCPFFDPEDRQCKACTCFIDLKCPIATEKCPKGRWGRFWGWRH
jgi:hypothetical protein